MKYAEKIAVFDLDGTLWDKNSHIEILNAYYKTNFFSSFIFRGISHFFRKQMYKFIWYCYRKIPKEFVFQFKLQFNKETLELLKTTMGENYFCLILSNAPYEIVFHAAERLKIPFLQAPQYQKKKILDENYRYSQLFVCTDNIEDLDLLEASNSRKIIFTKHNAKVFNKAGFYED